MHSRHKMPYLVGLLMLIILALGWVGNSLVNRVAQLTEDLYEHPLTVETAVLRINANVIAMHRAMKDVVLSESLNEAEQFYRIVEQTQEKVLSDFSLAEERFLGDKEAVVAARTAFVEWQPIREDVIRRVRAGKQAEAAIITRTEGSRRVEVIETRIGVMREFARNKSREFLAAAKDARRRTLQFGWLGLAGSVILAWFIMRKAVRLESDLQELNLGLDQKVRQRTAELATANENLAVQYEEIATMNEELTAQHEEITALNEDLEQRVEQRTADLSSANVELERKNEEMSRFVYTVSHDLRSPLVTIKAFLGYLEQDIKEKQTEAADKDMVYIRNAADKMAVLLDELLKLSRIGSKGNLKAEISLQTLAGEVLDLLAGRISGRGVRVSVTEEPVVVYGDIARLTELYQNLIDNAVKFMGDQTDPVIEIGARQEPTGITLYVRDNGSGIDPRHQKKLFGLFEKLDTLTEGVGMGLAIARRVVELHEGTIWVESGGAGTGATFYFKLARTRIGKSEGGSA